MSTYTIQNLLDIMAKMRAEGGCPWDREQTLESLKQYLVEECYEVIDAIDSGKADKHADELGDLLLQVVFQAQIRREQGLFAFEDVVERICAKLIRRHPHVFGDAKVADATGVLVQWDQIKRNEKGGETSASALAGVPRNLPALPRAQQVQKRAAKVGFDWPSVDGVLAKIDEELGELRAAVAAGDRAAVNEEIGDLLFSVVNLSRFQNHEADEALRATIRKFETRFAAIEAELAKTGKRPEDCTLEELDAIWNRVKR